MADISATDEGQPDAKQRKTLSAQAGAPANKTIFTAPPGSRTAAKGMSLIYAGVSSLSLGS